MGTPFYSPENGADGQGNYPNQSPQWGQNPGAQYPYGEQSPASYPPAQFAQQPYQQQYNQYQQYPQYPVQQKSMILAAVLAFFLGTLGVHNFYLGYTKAGIAQLSLTVLGYILAIVLVGIALLFVVGIWVFIDFIMILMRSGKYTADSRGVPLS